MINFFFNNYMKIPFYFDFFSSVYKMNLNILNNIKKFDNAFLPHQLATVDWMLRKDDDYLIFHKMGTGKTLTAVLYGLIKSKNNKIFIIAPNQLIAENWSIELKTGFTFMKSFLDYNEDNIVILTKKDFIDDIGDKNYIKFFNSYIIIDEAHNIFSNSNFNEKDKLENSYFILLTGTPLTNIVLPIKNILKIMGIDFNFKDGFEDNRVVNLALSNEEIQKIETGMKNKISSYNIESENIPKVIMEGDIKLGELNFIPISMTELENKNYLKIKNYISKDMFSKTLSNVSIISFDSISIYENFQKFILEDKNIKLTKDLYLSEGEIGGKGLTTLESTSKIKFLMDLLINPEKKYPGKFFIFLNSVSIGFTILKKIFLNFGISDYENKASSDFFLCINCGYKKTCDKCYPMKALFISSLESINKFQMVDYLNTFNSTENIDGKLIYIIIGSNMMKEAYNLKEVRNIVFLNYPNNYLTYRQILYRALRFSSYSDISKPVGLWNLLYLIEGEDILNIDEYDSIEKIDSIIGYDLKKMVYTFLKYKNTSPVLDALDIRGKKDSIVDKDLNIDILNLILFYYVKNNIIKTEEINIDHLVKITYDDLYRFINIDKIYLKNYTMDLIRSEVIIDYRLLFLDGDMIKKINISYPIDRATLVIPINIEDIEIDFLIDKERYLLTYNKKKEKIYLDYGNRTFRIEQLNKDLLEEILKVLGWKNDTSLKDKDYLINLIFSILKNKYD